MALRLTNSAYSAPGTPTLTAATFNSARTALLLSQTYSPLSTNSSEAFRQVASFSEIMDSQQPDLRKPKLLRQGSWHAACRQALPPAFKLWGPFPKGGWTSLHKAPAKLLSGLDILHTLSRPTIHPATRIKPAPVLCQLTMASTPVVHQVSKASRICSPTCYMDHTPASYQTSYRLTDLCRVRRKFTPPTIAKGGPMTTPLLIGGPIAGTN